MYPNSRENEHIIICLGKKKIKDLFCVRIEIKTEDSSAETRKIAHVK